MSLNEEEKRALNYVLHDYNEWALNAVRIGAYKSVEDALTNKLKYCIKMMENVSPEDYTTRKERDN